MKMLRERWIAFLAIVADPPSIILVICTLILAAVLVLQSDKSSPTNLDKVMTVTLTFLVSLSSGILGGLLGKRWDDYVGERVIVARGKSAIRSLKLLLGSTVALQNRVQLFSKRVTTENSTNEENKHEEVSATLVTTHLEEVIGRCILLAEGVLSSIESWTDIIPEADVKTQIGVITDLNQQLEQRNGELIGLSSELSETKGKSQAEILKLTDDKRHKEEEISQLRQKLAQQTYNLLPTGTSASLLTTGSNPSLSPSISLSPSASRSPSASISPSASPSPSASIPVFRDSSFKPGSALNSQPAKKCSNCGKSYQDTPGTNSTGTLCPDCANKGKTTTE